MTVNVPICAFYSPTHTDAKLSYTFKNITFHYVVKRTTFFAPSDVFEGNQATFQSKLNIL